MNYKYSAAGKGAQDRSSVSARSSSPLWKQVKLNNGMNLTPEEAATALNEINQFLNELINNQNIDNAIKEDILQWKNNHYNEDKTLI